MKKIAKALFICALLALALTGCGKTGKCDICGEDEVKVKEHEIANKEYNICKDCEDEIEEFKKELEALVD